MLNWSAGACSTRRCHGDAPDGGRASGVMMAQVRSVPEVEKLVRWMKYHPEGERGLFLGSYEAEFGAKPAPQHVADSIMTATG